LIPTNNQLQTGVREAQEGRAHRVKALLRVDDKKELSNPPRIQEKEFKEPERISLRTPKDLELKETELVSVFFRLKFSLSI
jgi:hypothetical protein